MFIESNNITWTPVDPATVKPPQSGYRIFQDIATGRWMKKDKDDTLSFVEPTDMVPVAEGDTMTANRINHSAPVKDAVVHLALPAVAKAAWVSFVYTGEGISELDGKQYTGDGSVTYAANAEGTAWVLVSKTGATNAEIIISDTPPTIPDFDAEWVQPNLTVTAIDQDYYLAIVGYDSSIEYNWELQATDAVTGQLLTPAQLAAVELTSTDLGPTPDVCSLSLDVLTIPLQPPVNGFVLLKFPSPYRISKLELKPVGGLPNVTAMQSTFTLFAKPADNSPSEIDNQQPADNNYTSAAYPASTEVYVPRVYFNIPDGNGVRRWVEKIPNVATQADVDNAVANKIVDAKLLKANLPTQGTLHDLGRTSAIDVATDQNGYLLHCEGGKGYSFASANLKDGDVFHIVNKSGAAVADAFSFVGFNTVFDQTDQGKAITSAYALAAEEYRTIRITENGGNWYANITDGIQVYRSEGAPPVPTIPALWYKPDYAPGPSGGLMSFPAVLDGSDHINPDNVLLDDGTVALLSSQLGLVLACSGLPLLPGKKLHSLRVQVKLSSPNGDSPYNLVLSKADNSTNGFLHATITPADGMVTQSHVFDRTTTGGDWVTPLAMPSTDDLLDAGQGWTVVVAKDFFNGNTMEVDYIGVEPIYAGAAAFDLYANIDGAWVLLKKGSASSTTLQSPDTNTYTEIINGRINFVVDGKPVGNVVWDADLGMPKWFLGGGIDPVFYQGTGQTIAQRDALVAKNPADKAGYFVYVKDTDNGVNEYQFFDGSRWHRLGLDAADALLGSFTGRTIADNVTLKAALQALETKVENIELLGDLIGSFATFADLPAPTAEIAHDLAAVQQDTKGTGSKANPQYPSGLYAVNGAGDSWGLVLRIVSPGLLTDAQAQSTTDDTAGLIAGKTLFDRDQALKGTAANFAVDDADNATAKPWSAADLAAALDPLQFADVAALQGLDTTKLRDKREGYIIATKEAVYFSKAATTGDYTPTTGGGKWLKTASAQPSVSVSNYPITTSGSGYGTPTSIGAANRTGGVSKPPATLNSFGMYDADWDGELQLPVPPAAGSRFDFRNDATLNVSVLTTNTNLPSAITVSTGHSLHFVSTSDGLWRWQPAPFNLANNVSGSVTVQTGSHAFNETSSANPSASFAVTFPQPFANPPKVELMYQWNYNASTNGTILSPPIVIDGEPTANGFNYRINGNRNKLDKVVWTAIDPQAIIQAGTVIATAYPITVNGGAAGSFTGHEGVGHETFYLTMAVDQEVDAFPTVAGVALRNRQAGMFSVNRALGAGSLALTGVTFRAMSGNSRYFGTFNNQAGDTGHAFTRRLLRGSGITTSNDVTFTLSGGIYRIRSGITSHYGNATWRTTELLVDGSSVTFMRTGRDTGNWDGSGPLEWVVDATTVNHTVQIRRSSSSGNGNADGWLAIDRDNPVVAPDGTALYSPRTVTGTNVNAPGSRDNTVTTGTITGIAAGSEIATITATGGAAGAIRNTGRGGTALFDIVPQGADSEVTYTTRVWRRTLTATVNGAAANVNGAATNNVDATQAVSFALTLPGGHVMTTAPVIANGTLLSWAADGTGSILPSNADNITIAATSAAPGIAKAWWRSNATSGTFAGATSVLTLPSIINEQTFGGITYDGVKLAIPSLPYAIRLAAYLYTYGSGTHYANFYFRRTADPIGTPYDPGGNNTQVLGGYGQHSPNMPATLVVPANTALTLNLVHQASANNQSARAGSGIYIERL